MSVRFIDKDTVEIDETKPAISTVAAVTYVGDIKLRIQQLTDNMNSYLPLIAAEQQKLDEAKSAGVDVDALPATVAVVEGVI